MLRAFRGPFDSIRCRSAPLKVTAGRFGALRRQYTQPPRAEGLQPCCSSFAGCVLRVWVVKADAPHRRLPPSARHATSAVHCESQPPGCWKSRKIGYLCPESRCKGAYLKSRSVSSAVLGRIRVPLGAAESYRPAGMPRSARRRRLRVAARFRFRRSEQLHDVAFGAPQQPVRTSVARHVACAGIVGMAVETASRLCGVRVAGGWCAAPGQMQVSFSRFADPVSRALRPEAPPAPYLAVHRRARPGSIVVPAGTMA